MDEKYKQAFAEVAKSDRRALAEIITEYLNPNHIAVDVVGMLLNTRVLKPGDALVKKVRRGIEVRQLSPGQTTLAQQFTLRESVSYNLDAAYAHVAHNLWEIESGELGTIDFIRNELTKQLADFYATKVFTAMATLADVNNPSGWSFAGSTVTRTALEDMIDHIRDVAGGVKVVVGRRTALAPITKFAGYRYEASNIYPVPVNSALEEIRRTGWFGTYYGADFLALERVVNNNYDMTELIPSNIIIVVGNNCGEFIVYGDPREDQWDDLTTAPPTWNYRVYSQYGMIFDRMENVGIIQLA